MAIEVFNRYEHKYLLDFRTYEAAVNVLKKHMEPDKYNIDGMPYTISNIYYDTEDDRLIRNSLSKPIYKEKLRLRAYGVPDSGSSVFLEIKKKFNGLVNKRRTVLKLDEAYEFVRSGIKPDMKSYMNPQVIDEIAYFLRIYDLKPKLYLAYDRIAFFEKDNPDLRISFDTAIRTRRYGLRLENGDFGNPLLNQITYLMEIKTSLAKPLWLVNMLSEFGIRRCSFSKYGTEYMQNLELKNIKTAI